MSENTETIGTIRGRLEVLRKSLVSEENSAQYYVTLLEKTPEDSEENLGARKMYQDLHEEEKRHVETIKALIERWEKILSELQGS